MPIYAFACDACGHAFDRLQKLSDSDPHECPACAAQALRRQLTAPQFRLSGAGWYETDFKKDGDSKRNLAGEGGEGAQPAPEPKADVKSDTKPDAKPDAKPTTKPESIPRANAGASLPPSPAAVRPEPAKPKPANPS